MSSTKKLRHIELFAGCGGMTLGLEAAGFDLFFANELSPMAGETFAYNFLGVDLQRGDPKGKVLWIETAYPRDAIHARLREQPGAKGRLLTDIDAESTRLKNKLLIGDVRNLVSLLRSEKHLLEQVSGVDLVSGGPPCQGFSMAGKRIKDDHKNQLPADFAEFCGLVRPRIVLLENVKGILAPFRATDGHRHYAYLEVAKAFAFKGYYPVCMLVNSKYFGIAQNRPRFIMYAFREDVLDKLLSKPRKPLPAPAIEALVGARAFYYKATEGQQLHPSDLKVHDIEREGEGLFNGSFFPHATHLERALVGAREAIGDLHGASPKGYPKKLAKVFPPHAASLSTTGINNHEKRSHTFKVRARFRIYQVLQPLEPWLRKAGLELLAGNKQEEYAIKSLFKKIRDESFLLGHDQGHEAYLGKIRTLHEFQDYMASLVSKKHSQRALAWDEPAPAQLTIPDDLCHYDQEELRTLTVREMARFQSFPDWFEFRSKVTTGGTMRSYEVPQYTQVGNAVPPMLARELGLALKHILDHL